MNDRDVRDFLMSRRARITPEQAGLTAYGHNRRVPGLRREEVAILAGVSADYYTRLEKGDLSGVSDSVVAAIARALRLDEAERLHLRNLARSTPPADVSTTGIRPGLHVLLDGMTNTAALIRNGRLDILATNRLARVLYAPLFTSGLFTSGPPNFARFRFLSPAARDFYPDYDTTARTTVALLRLEAGRTPNDRSLQALIADLSAQSPTFRTLWATHDVHLHRTGQKRFHHPTAGPLTLTYESMTIEADSHLTLATYTADTPSDYERLRAAARQPAGQNT